MSITSKPISAFTPSFTPSDWASYKPSKVEAFSPVDKFGPVPDAVLCPKVQAPEGSRYCEEIHAFVPKGLPFRIRGIEGTKPIRQSRKGRFFRGLFNRQPENMIMAMGLTHGDLNLIPLGEAQQRAEIVHHSVDTLNDADLFTRGFRTDLVSICDARQSPEIKYRTVL